MMLISNSMMTLMSIRTIPIKEYSLYWRKSKKSIPIKRLNVQEMMSILINWSNLKISYLGFFSRWLMSISMIWIKSKTRCSKWRYI